MSFCMIENRVNQIPSVELMRMLGASASRGQEKRIGQFGSGFPYSLAMLARFGLLESLKVCLGLDVYTFSVQDYVVKDSNGNRIIESEIFMKKQNGKICNLNVSTGFGELDWDDVTMALREFVSNACDGAESFDGTYRSVNIKTDISEEGRTTNAKDGYIRIYLKTTPTIDEYLNNIRRTFICLNTGYNPNISIVPNIKSNCPAKIFRKGVLVGEFGTSSLFHYNLPDISLKESRNVDSSEARSASARAICRCKDKSILIPFIKMLSEEKSGNLFEHSFSSWEYDPNYYGDDKDKEIWRESMREVLNGSIVCESDTTYNLVKEKGLSAVKANATFAKLAKIFGGRMADSVLNQNEIEGRELINPAQNTIDCLNFVWTEIELAGMTAGKMRPFVKGFRQNTSSGMLGYYRITGDTVFIRDDIMEDKGVMLRSTMIEEVAHYITGAQDYTREFQDFIFKLCAVVMGFREI